MPAVFVCISSSGRTGRYYPAAVIAARIAAEVGDMVGVSPKILEVFTLYSLPTDRADGSG